MSEISMYEAQKKKMQGLCDEHELIYRFIKDKYPITFTIRPMQGMDAQLTMLENVEEVGYRSPDASMTWIFENGVLSTKVQGGIFTISKTLRTKIELVLIKMISFWQQYFFRDILEKKLLSQTTMPVIDEDDAEDIDGLPDGAESLETYDDLDEPPEVEEAPDIGEVCEDDSDLKLNEDDPDIAEAASIIRAENKASTSLLQRRMNIGYAKAARIIDVLEGLGVVGPYNGSQPREVLPFDEPDDSAEEVGADANGT